MFPALGTDDALFIDFDGTLVEFAPEPDAVVVSSELPELLGGLHGALGGALAVISGRPIEALDRYLTPLRLPAAGEHGAELRFHLGDSIAHSTGLPPRAVQSLREISAGRAGTLLELKTASAAIHYRNAPQQAVAVRAALEDLVPTIPGYELLEGKMVCEFKPVGVDKGRALLAMLDRPPFDGRRPVFLGDDVTDEAGFSAVNTLGGISIKVGQGVPSEAGHRLGSVGEVNGWLRGFLRSVEER